MANSFNFTIKRLKEVKPSEKRAYYYDTTQPGLRLAVSPSGNKSYQFQNWSKQKGRPLTRTLGKMGTMSITEARGMAASLLAEVNAGFDIEETRRNQREEPIFSDVFESYFEGYAKIRNRTWKNDERTYNNHFKKFFGSKRIEWFSVEKVRQWHNGIGENSGPYMANRALALLSGVFNHELRGRVNPCHGVKRFKEQSRDRFLQPDELERFFTALQEEPNRIIADCLMILVLTGARRSNVCSMRWDDIDFARGIWKIPASESKNAESMSIPLVPEVIYILENRKQMVNGLFVFPGRGMTGHLVEPKKGWARILKTAGLVDVRIHDLRRTMGSYMAGVGSSTIIIGKALGHKSPQSTAVYTRLNIDPVREAMEKASQVMLKSNTGEKGEDQ